MNTEIKNDCPTLAPSAVVNETGKPSFALVFAIDRATSGHETGGMATITVGHVLAAEFALSSRASVPSYAQIVFPNTNRRAIGAMKQMMSTACREGATDRYAACSRVNTFVRRSSTKVR